MSALRDSGATAHTITGIKMRDAGGVLRSIATAKMRDAGGVLRSIFTTGSASVSPNYSAGYASSGGSIDVTTSAVVTATPSGGTAPYTYAWAPSPAAAGWSAVSPTASSTLFRKTGVAAHTSATATFACTITDAGGNVITSDLVTASVTNIGPVPIYFP